MNWQASLLEPLVMAALVSGRSAWAAHRLGSAPSILVVLSACLGLVAALFLLAGGYIWLEHLYGTQLAVLIVGSAAASLSFLMLVASWTIIRIRRKRIAAYQGNIMKTVESAIESLMSEIEEPVRNNPKSAVALAAMAGYMAGGKMQDGAENVIHAFERIKHRF